MENGSTISVVDTGEEYKGHSDRAHALLSPSSLSRLFLCPGSVALSEGIEQTPSEYAFEGTRAHEASEYLLIATLKQSIGFNGFDGDFYTAEMQKYAQRYVKIVMSALSKLKDATVKVEETVALTDKTWGTLDFCAYNDDWLLILDYKFGKKKVQVKENLQLMCYAAAACNTFQIKPKSIKLAIYQPRSNTKKKLSSWDTTYDYLENWLDSLWEVEDKVMEAIDKYKEGKDIKNYLYMGGAGHCWFCPAKDTTCPLQKEAREARAEECISMLDILD